METKQETEQEFKEFMQKLVVLELRNKNEGYRKGILLSVSDDFFKIKTLQAVILISRAEVTEIKIVNGGFRNG